MSSYLLRSSSTYACCISSAFETTHTTEQAQQQVCKWAEGQAMLPLLAAQLQAEGECMLLRYTWTKQVCLRSKR